MGMNAPALLIDFGSTFTKVAAVDLEAARIVATAQAPSTVTTDVGAGLLHAIEQLAARRPGIFGERSVNLDALLDGACVRACSSAAGGLRIVVIGLVPGLTVEAANAAALGAGGKVVRAFGFKLADEDLAEIERLKPDLVLLTGGTDGGDTHTILHNAAILARSRLSMPFVVAGNRAATTEIGKLHAVAGKEAFCTANVMPDTNAVRPEAVQDEIRRQFMQRIIQAKGLDKIRARVRVVLPTPVAVLNAALLGSRGVAGQGGCGDLLLVDVGGATTDVHSIGQGKAPENNIIPQGLPQPFAKRTVEGDLGIRCNASSILDRVGADRLRAEFETIFPEHRVDRADFLAYIARVSEDTDAVPRQDWQSAIDAILARAAVDLAIERHVGKREPYYSSAGTVFLQAGKNLTEVPIVIGTGGIFTHNPYADRILTAATQMRGQCEVLRPAGARVIFDHDYVLYAVGLLSDTHPSVALQLFRHHLLSRRDHRRTGQLQQGPLEPSAAGHGHSCCS
jgi:uncharacterized protein (TIGR01319 family)